MGVEASVPGVEGAPQGPCRAELDVSFDRWYRMLEAPVRAGKW